MILTCPNCDAQFKVAAGAVPSEGREVRCSSCSHQWHAYPDARAVELTPPPIPIGDEPKDEPVPLFSAGEERDLVAFQEYHQEEPDEPEEETFAEEAAASEEPADPQLTVPDTSFLDEPEVPDVVEEMVRAAARKPDPIDLKPLMALAACLLVVVIVTSLFAFRPALQSSLGGFYQMFGGTPTGGLKLADVEMRERQLRSKIKFVFEGQFLNESKEERQVPVLRVTLVDQSGEVTQSRDYIPDESEKIKAGSSYHFMVSNIETTQRETLDYVMLDIGNGLELGKRPMKWVAH